MSQVKRGFIRPLILLSIIPVHELGHILAANFYGFPILQISFSYTRIHFVRIPTAIQETLIYMGGFLVTFVPASILTIYMMKTGSLHWDLPFLWVMASPGVAVHDLYHVGSLLLNETFGFFMAVTALTSTAGMFLFFLES